jgi:hypothetical protein
VLDLLALLDRSAWYVIDDVTVRVQPDYLVTSTFCAVLDVAFTAQRRVQSKLVLDELQRQGRNLLKSDKAGLDPNRRDTDISVWKHSAFIWRERSEWDFGTLFAIWKHWMRWRAQGASSCALILRVVIHGYLMARE